MKLDWLKIIFCYEMWWVLFKEESEQKYEKMIRKEVNNNILI